MPEKNKKILVVEDDELVSETLQSILNGAGYETKVAGNGNEACSVLALEGFDLVLTDIRMPGMTGIELLHHIKRNHGTPVILMTGFSEIADAQEAFEIGAVGFLPKPFRKPDILEALANVFNLEGGGKTQEETDDQFCPIRIDDFTSGQEIQYNIYIRISKAKYLKIASGGSNLDMSQIRRFKEKGISHLHLSREDFRRYLGFSLELARKVARAEQIEIKRKVQFLLQTTLETTKNLFVNGVDRESFEISEEAVVLAIGVVAEAPDIYSVLERLRSHTDHLYAHSLAVAIYSTMIAKKIGWKSPRTAAKISMCGLFHDIGKKEIDPEILKKPRIRRTPEETKVFESHATRGSEIVDLLRIFPEEVSQVAGQHHENCAGLGYPMRLSKIRIQPIARLVGLANDFCNLIVHNVDQPEPVDPRESVSRLEQTGNKYDPEFLEGLKKLLTPAAPPPPAQPS